MQVISSYDSHTVALTLSHNHIDRTNASPEGVTKGDHFDDESSEDEGQLKRRVLCKVLDYGSWFETDTFTEPESKPDHRWLQLAGFYLGLQQ